MKNKLKSTFLATIGSLMPTSKSPDEGLGELFRDVQKSQIYGDGKTFADLVPRKRMVQIQKEYMLAKQDPNFNLEEFLSLHFYKYSPHDSTFEPKAGASPREHINQLWDYLERKNLRDKGSLLALPNPYVVPGGRFAEQFYWDSYFIMLGLAADDRWRTIEGMIKNYAYMIRKFGFIPTANRSYFLSRSQPPVFALMVELLASHKGKRLTQVEYLPYMIAEYRFWMKRGHQQPGQPNGARLRMVEMPDGSVLNRYYDNKATPRPESLHEDTETLVGIDRDPGKLFLDLRASAESGWDFSSRWFADPQDIRTVHTTDFVAVDLNSLLYKLELTIAETYKLMLQPILAKRFFKRAEARQAAIQKYCWNQELGFFVDYDACAQKQGSELTLAAVFPLYTKVATTEQAAAVAARLEKDFLKLGGLVTTLHTNGQQWDAPNGWAPLHWAAIQGLRNYGHYRLANVIRERWLAANLKVFEQTGRFVEKYDVTDGARGGGGGEYPLQDGFGWTNGVYRALIKEQDNLA